MPQIYLTEDQVRAIAEDDNPVEVFGPDHELLGNLNLLSPQEREAIARHRRRNPKEVGIPGDRVQAFLQKLHTVADSEGIDEGKVKELLHLA